MEIMDCLMFAMIAGCIYGLYLTVSFTRKKMLSLLKGAGLGVILTAYAFMCCVMLVLPIDEPRYQVVKGDECAIVQVEDDFVVVQLGDGRLDTIYRTLHPITNWEPVERDLSREIDFREGSSTVSEDGAQYNLTNHYKDGSEKNCTMTFTKTLRPITNWEPVK